MRIDDVRVWRRNWEWLWITQNSRNGASVALAKVHVDIRVFCFQSQNTEKALVVGTVDLEFFVDVRIRRGACALDRVRNTLTDALFRPRILSALGSVFSHAASFFFNSSEFPLL